VPNERTKRKLAAIFSADVKGYSRLMADDEAATVRTINGYLTVMTGLITDHNGRVADAKGDNVLAEFPSVVDAVCCAVEIQNRLKERNAQLPEHRRMEFRVGINLGDVIEEGDTIYGDGVNVAARLEGLAEGGGICISGTVYDQIDGKVALELEYLGEKSVKNIKKPVRVYQVMMETKTGSALSEDIQLPDKPSIAVLPFVNLSGDPEQEYFCDGMTEDLITDLSKVSGLFVIARNSTFVYKGKPTKAQEISRELGIRFLLEGSVRKAGNRVRINAQLIDAVKGDHLWAERYDRDILDFFALQDEITKEIVVALQVKLTHGEQVRTWYKTTENLQAWGYVVKGTDLFEHYTKEDNAKARTLFEQAVHLDPDYASAWTKLAWTHFIDVRLGISKDPSESLKKAIELAKKASALDDKLPDIHSFWNSIYFIQKQPDKAIAEGEKAITLDPNNAWAHILQAQTMHFAGRFEESISLAKKAMRLSPYYPAWYLVFLGHSYYLAGRHDEALAVYRKVLDRSKKGEYNIMLAHMYLADCYRDVGREEEARFHSVEVLRIDPNFSLEYLDKVFYYVDPAHLKKRKDNLRKAGLPGRSSIAVRPLST
jgi:adenylate cyclase